MEEYLILADIITASAIGKVEEVKVHFKKLCELQGFKVSGKEADYSLISQKAAELLRIIAAEEDSETTLSTLGSLIGLNIVKNDIEEGNELIPE